MIVIKKMKGNIHELMNMKRQTFKELKKDGYDFIPLFENFYVFANYKDTFEDENYNCTIISPKGGKSFCFGVVYIFKKSFFGIKNLSKKDM